MTRLLAFGAAAFGWASLGIAQWSTVGEGMNGGSGIRAMFFDSLSNRIYCFGGFYNAGGVVANGAAYWDGSEWYSMGQGITNDQSDVVAALPLGGDSVIASGFFLSAMDVPNTRHTTIWDGSQWTSIGPGGTHGIAWRMLLNEDGLTLGGQMDTIVGIPISNLTRYENGQWTSICTYPNWPLFNSANAIVKFQGQYLVGGNINSPDVKDIGWLDGDTLRQLGPGILGDPLVNDMVLFRGDVFVGGDFYAIWGNAASGIMKWDGTSFSDPFPGVQYTGMVHEMDVHNDELYISGRVVVPGSPDYYQFARFDGERICLFGKNLNAAFRAITATETELFVAPNMPTLGLGGDTVNYIVRYDLSYPPDTCIVISTGIRNRTIPYPIWSIGPNPCSGQLTLTSNSSVQEGQGCYLYIHDTIGKELLRHRVPMVTGNAPLVVPLPHLAAGLVLATLADESGTVLHTQRLIVAH